MTLELVKDENEQQPAAEEQVKDEQAMPDPIPFPPPPEGAKVPTQDELQAVMAIMAILNTHDTTFVLGIKEDAMSLNFMGKPIDTRSIVGILEGVKLHVMNAATKPVAEKKAE